MEVPYPGRDLRGRPFLAKGIHKANFSKAELQETGFSLAVLRSDSGGNKGGEFLTTANTRVLVALIVITFLLGMVMYLTGAGTAIGAFLVVFVLTLMASMFSNGNNSRGDQGHPGLAAYSAEKRTSARTHSGYLPGK